MRCVRRIIIRQVLKNELDNIIYKKRQLHTYLDSFVDVEFHETNGRKSKPKVIDHSNKEHEHIIVAAI